MTAVAKSLRTILYVIGSLELGGAEQHIVQVACQLKARGWAPEFFVFTRGGPLTENLLDAAIPIHGYSIPYWLQLLFRSQRIQARISLIFLMLAMIRIMLGRRPLVVHCFLPGAYLLGGLAAIITATHPRLMSRRSMNNYQKAHPISSCVERFLHPRMSKICGNSRAVIAELESEGVAESQLTLIYNGIDLARFSDLPDHDSVRNRLNISPDALVLVIVANLIPYKGHRDLLSALAGIYDKLPQPWICLCVGRDDGIGNELRSLAIELAIQDNLRWLGSRSDVPELLSASDIGILCSHEEGFSNAILEGMAAGLPMVVTDVGGNREAVVDGETGIVVPPKSPVALAEAILVIANNPQRDEMGKRGRARVAAMFSLERCVDAYEELYRQL